MLFIQNNKQSSKAIENIDFDSMVTLFFISSNPEIISLCEQFLFAKREKSLLVTNLVIRVIDLNNAVFKQNWLHNQWRMCRCKNKLPFSRNCNRAPKISAIICSNHFNVKYTIYCLLLSFRHKFFMGSFLFIGKRIQNGFVFANETFWVLLMIT